MGRVDQSTGELIPIDNEAVTDADRQDAESRAHPHVADAVVRLGCRGGRDSGPVAEVGRVARVVVAAFEAAVGACEEVVA